MSLTLLDNPVSGRITAQLHQHLTDMTELCSQVRSARDGETADDEVTRSLYDELIATLESHTGMIAERLSDLDESEFSDSNAHDAARDVATCSR